MVRLIDDDELKLALKEAFGVLAAPRRGDGGDDAVLAPERVRVLTHARVVGGGEGQAELALHGARR